MRLSLVAAAALCISTIAAHASTIVYANPSNTSVSAINELTVDGTTYNVSFAAYVPSTTFQGNQAGALDATNAIIAALNSSTAAYVFYPGNGSGSGFGVQWDGTDKGYGGTSYGTVGNWTIYGSDITSSGIAIFSATTAAATPEPSSLLLLGTGIIGTAGMLRRRFLA